MNAVRAIEKKMDEARRIDVPELRPSIGGQKIAAGRQEPDAAHAVETGQNRRGAIRRFNLGNSGRGGCRHRGSRCGRYGRWWKHLDHRDPVRLVASGLRRSEITQPNTACAGLRLDRIYWLSYCRLHASNMCRIVWRIPITVTKT